MKKHMPYIDWITRPFYVFHNDMAYTVIVKQRDNETYAAVVTDNGDYIMRVPNTDTQKLLENVIATILNDTPRG
jgi:hypothetical protein